MVDIVRYAGTCQVRWAVPPNERYLGICLVAEHSLAVGYFGGVPGVVLYRIDRDEQTLRLIGQWTAIHAGRPSQLTEVIPLLVSIENKSPSPLRIRYQ
jgi:hypothetical protein